MFKTETRRITAIVSGISKQRITNYVNPEGIGRLLKSFIMVDRFDSGLAMAGEATSFPMHSHSGIVSMTYLMEGNGLCVDSTGSSDMVEAESIEWLVAGKGVWHKSAPTPGVRTRGVQLWIALSPEQENCAPIKQHFGENELPKEGGVKVLVGSYGSLRSPVDAGPLINCFAVELTDGQSWQYQPPTGHSISWLLSLSGSLRVGDVVLSEEMGLLGQDNKQITAVAEGKAAFLFGCSTEHPYPLVRAGGSIHTNPLALKEAQEEISRIGTALSNAS